MEIALQYWQQVLDLWNALSYDVRWYIWAGSGILILLGFMALSYRFLRRLAGHRKHRGTWYDEDQYATLMTMFHEHAQTRVLQHEDMQALRAWQYGDKVKPLFGDRKYGGYF